MIIAIFDSLKEAITDLSDFLVEFGLAEITFTNFMSFLIYFMRFNLFSTTPILALTQYFLLTSSST
jgi:hypothetical protein